MAAQDPTSPDAAFQDASQVGTVKRDWTERIGGALAGAANTKNNPLREALDAHHQRRIDQAEMYKKNAATAKGALWYDDQMREKAKTDPEAVKGYTFLTDEQRQTHQNNYDYAWGQYEKIAGVDKNTKSALQRAKAIIEHVTKTGQGGQPGQPSQQGQQQGRPGGLTPPPQAQGQADAGPALGGGASSGGTGITPPPQPPGADDQEASYKKFAATAPFERQQLEQRQALQAYTDKEKALYKLKIEEDAARAKAKSAAHPTRPAPGQYSTSVLDARTTGQVYMGFDGNPLDLDKIPDTMGLKGALVYNPDTEGWDVRYTTFSPNQSSVTVGGVTFAINPMDKSKLPQGAGQELGAHNIATTTRTTDPATGQTTVSKHTPQITGVGGRPGSTSITPPPTPQEAAPRKSSGGAPLSKTADIQLDDSGHIPNNWHGASPQVIEGANQLKDGMDLKDIGGTSKTKPLSEALARRAFGWSRDKFTPIEHTQIALASRYIGEAIQSPSLKSLDQGFISQLPMIGASSDPAKEGTVGKAITKLSAMATTKDQQEFLRLYRQMAGTISGLGRLSRGGRITEATVNRLLSELPNPSNTTNSKDAIERLKRLKDEVDSALSHDSFETIAKGREAAPRKGGITPPPKPGQSNGKLSDAAKKWLEANP